MALGKYDSRHHTTTCPVVGCNTRIFMERGSYAAHMVASHSATDTVFPDEGIRGKNLYDHGIIESEGTDIIIYREDNMLAWCGCGSTTRSWGSLLSHLADDHGVVT